MRLSSLVVVAGTLILLSGCGGDPADAVAKAEAAQGEALTEYARNIAETVDIAANPDLVQRFCLNGLGAACPEGITDKLKEFGYASGGTGDVQCCARIWVACSPVNGTRPESA